MRPLVLTACILLVLTPVVILRGQEPHGPLSVTIKGDPCVNSTLTIDPVVPAASIVWTQDGTNVVSRQTSYLTGPPAVVAGNGGEGTGANQLYAPDRLYVDAGGNMYIPDLGNSRVQKWMTGASSGVTIAGGNGTGNTLNRLDRPSGVFVDGAGNVYVAEQNNNRVTKWAPGATVGVVVAGGSGELNYPTDVYMDPNGYLYVSDQFNNRVLKYAPGVTNFWTIAAGDGTYGNGPTQLASPTGIFVDAVGNVYVCDTDNSRVQRWGPGASTGNTVAGGNGTGNAANQLANPLGLYVDCAATIYIADYNNSRVQVWTFGATAGTTLVGAGATGVGAIPLGTPAAVFLDADYNVYISDFSNDRILKISHSIVTSYTPTAAGSYTATVITPCGMGTSNTIDIGTPRTPLLTISSDAKTACPGAAVTFTATPTYGGTSPVFQWTKNKIPVGTNSPVYVDNNIANGDIINCNMISNDHCLSSFNATSNTIILSKFPPPNLGPDVVICPGDAVRLNAHSGYASYTWQDGSTDSVYLATGPGKYYVDVKDVCGDPYSDTLNIGVYPIDAVFLPADTSMCSYDRLLIQSSGKFRQYLWNDGSRGTSITVDAPGLYWLQVTDDNQCKIRDSILISPQINCHAQGVYVPKAFTPNGDGRNDIFRPMAYGDLVSYRFAVYNRYGQLVFSTTQPGLGWDGEIDGRPAADGTFVWYCAYQFTGGVKRVEKGTVELIR